MGKRIQKSVDVPTFTHRFENGDWVEMKVGFRLGDRDAINASMFQPERKLNEKTGDLEYTGGVKLDTSLANVATLTRAITDWGGEGFETNGVKDEINMENVAGLDENDAKELLAALQARNPRPVGPKAPADSGTTATSTSAS